MRSFDYGKGQGNTDRNYSKWVFRAFVDQVDFVIEFLTENDIFLDLVMPTSFVYH